MPSAAITYGVTVFLTSTLIVGTACSAPFSASLRISAMNSANFCEAVWPEVPGSSAKTLRRSAWMSPSPARVTTRINAPATR